MPLRHAIITPMPFRHTSYALMHADTLSLPFFERHYLRSRYAADADVIFATLRRLLRRRHYADIFRYYAATLDSFRR